LAHHVPMLDVLSISNAEFLAGEHSSMRKHKGFSLIELLIVVAIILIIAAIAIPNLLRAREAANEASAVASIRTINTAEITYSSTYPTVGFAANLSVLGGVAPCTPASTTACLIDSVLSAGKKSGFNFTEAPGVVATPQTTYYTTAVPVTLDQTGTRSFCSFEDAVVRVQPTGAAIGAESACQALGPLNQ
jgi:type IV pilus assembly protein PilA